MLAQQASAASVSCAAESAVAAAATSGDGANSACCGAHIRETVCASNMTNAVMTNRTRAPDPIRHGRKIAVRDKCRSVFVIGERVAPKAVRRLDACQMTLDEIREAKSFDALHARPVPERRTHALRQPATEEPKWRAASPTMR